MNEVLTPLTISQENTVECVESEYDWITQSRGDLNAMTPLVSWSTSTQSHSGNAIWSGDTDSDQSDQ